MTNEITIKLFSGYPFTSDIKMYLSQNAAWKQASVLPDGIKQVFSLDLVHYHGKDYLGCFLPSLTPSLLDIQEKEQFVSKQLCHLCPDLVSKKMKFNVFAQLFIA